MALPFLLSLGLPALGAATGGLGLGLGAATLSGIGAGLGSFLQTGDVGKGIQTGLVAGLGGKLMGSAANALGNMGAQGATQVATQGAATAAQAAAPSLGSKIIDATFSPSTLATQVGQTTVSGLLGAAGSGFNTALIADAMNQPTVEMPDKKSVDTSPPMPRIRSYRPLLDPYSTAEQDMITYYNPVTRMNYGGYLHRPSYGGMGGRFNAGIASVSGGSHPIFQGFGEQMAGFLTQSQTEENKEKVQPFVQEVETLAKTTFGDEAFQNAQVAGQLQALDGPDLRDATQYQRVPNIAQGGKGAVGGLENRAAGVSKFAKALGALRRPGAIGYAEGGIVAEELNDKELIAEAVAAVKGESDNPKEVLGVFLLRFGEEQLRNLVQSVQSGELDETQERFEKGDKGMVNGPGDGSGKDDMVPASMDGEQDVLLTAGEFVMKKDSTDAIERAFGGGFLDEINDAGKDAPKKLKQKVAVA